MTLRPFSGRVFFDHLPKTAGSAIGSWLVQSLGAGCVSPTYAGYHRELIRQYGGIFPVICAHSHFRDGEGLDRRYQYITFLRDPVERVLSWLYFVINDQDISHPPHLILMAKRFLDSDGDDLDKEIEGGLANMYAEHFCRINGSGEAPESSKLENAFLAIKEYDVVGVDADMSSFLTGVADLLQLPHVNSIPRVNVTSIRPNREKISSKLRSRIEELNRMDLKLFEDVCAWKKDSEKSPSPRVDAVTECIWAKQEPFTGKTVITGDLILGSIVLREGIQIAVGQLMTFDLEFLLKQRVEKLELGIHIFDEGGRLAFGLNNDLIGQPLDVVESGAYRASHYIVANLPAGRYTAGFAFAGAVNHKRVQLAWYDIACEFVVSNAVGRSFVGHSNLPAAIALHATGLADPSALVNAPVGNLICNTALPTLSPRERATLQLRVSNTGQQTWVGDYFRPVKLSYHWLDEGRNVISFEGIRSDMPTGGIAGGVGKEVLLTIEAPPALGKYVLMATIVQEGHGWFEQLGSDFAPVYLEVLVASRFSDATTAPTDS